MNNVLIIKNRLLAIIMLYALGINLFTNHGLAFIPTHLDSLRLINGIKENSPHVKVSLFFYRKPRLCRERLSRTRIKQVGKLILLTVLLCLRIQNFRKISKARHPHIYAQSRIRTVGSALSITHTAGNLLYL